MDERKNLLKAAILVGLAGCAGMHDEAKAPHLIVLQIPKATSAPNYEPLAENAKGMKGGRKAEPQKKQATFLTIFSPDDNILQACLSVIQSDNSLDRVILDPKVTFYHRASSSSWESIPGCVAVPTCDIPARMKPMTFKADFSPESGTLLWPSVSEPYVWEPGQSSTY